MSVAGRALIVALLAAPHSAADPVEVIVRGQRSGPSARDETAASTVVRRADLRRAGADAAEVLERVPGVQVARTGSGADLATASIRGATSAQTPVYLAGIRLNDDLTGTADLSQLPLWMLDRVEVFRGNAPLEADRLGIGGAIFFEPILPSRSRVGGGLELGSFGERGVSFGVMVAAPGAASLLALRRHVADNDFEYLDDRGTALEPADDRVVRRPNADHASTDAWAVGRLGLSDRGRLTLVMNGFSREQGVTGLGVIPARRSRAHVQRFLAGVSSRIAYPNATLELTSSLLQAQNHVRDPERELSLGAIDVASEGQRFVQAGRLSHDLGAGFRLRAGASQELERLSIAADGARLLAARRATSRATLGLGWQTRALYLHALAALDCHSTAGPSGSDRCGTLAPSGRAGAALALGEHVTLLANAGRYVRVPTLGELYGISPAVRGNPELESERGLTVDLGARAASRRTQNFSAAAEAFVFARWVESLVAFRRSGFGYVRPFNLASARVLGAEVASHLDLWRHLYTELSLTLLDPRDTSADRQVKNDLIPHQSRLSGTLRSELYAERPIAGLDVQRVAFGARVSHRASRVADAAGLIVIADQTTLDLDASVLSWKERLLVSASVENLLDARRFDLVGFPLPGRSFQLAAELWWP